MVDPVEGWTAADYVEELGRVFAASGTYADKTKVWDYCVTITYAGDRRIDLAPCVVGRQWEGSIEVCGIRVDSPTVNLRELRQEPAQYKLREPRDMRITGIKPAVL